MVPVAPYDRIILKKVEEESVETVGMIIVSHAGNETAYIGEVVAVGPGFPVNHPHYVEMSLKVGDRVVYPKIGPSKITVKKQDYISMRAIEILAILEKGE